MRGTSKILLFKIPFALALVGYACNAEPESRKRTNTEIQQEKITEIIMRNRDSVIRWTEDYELGWYDFRKPIDGTEEFDAAVKTGITCGFNSNTKEYIVAVYAIMIKDSSYANKAVRKDAAALAHESAHFKLAEVRAREVRMKVSTWDGLGNIEDFLTECIVATDEVNDQRQDAYDDETAHGTIDSAQKEWYRKIDSLLSYYDAYADPTIRVQPADSKSK